MTLTLEGWIRRHRPVAGVADTLRESAEPPPSRSPAAAYAGLSCGSPQAERAGVPLAEYLGRTLRGQHRGDE